MVCVKEHTMKTGLNHAVRVTVAALSIVLGLGAAVPAAAQCPGDCYDDGFSVVNGADLAMLLGRWGEVGSSPADVNADGLVDGRDLSVVLGGWGPCPPVVTSILPNSGRTGGGTTITITGNYFSGSATVTLGGLPATNVQVMNTTTITAVTPAVSSGSVDVEVTANGRSGSLPKGFAFRDSGTVRAWGSNFYGQCNIPADLGPCTAIAGGWYHTIALRTDGTVRAWGNNFWGQCDVPSNLGPCTAVAGGKSHTIALRTDGTVRAWGHNYEGECNIPGDLGPCTAIAGGDRNTTALRADGIVRGWGYGYDIPSNLGQCTAIVGGYGHTIAIQP
jgi:hypothetical protein